MKIKIIQQISKRWGTFWSRPKRRDQAKAVAALMLGALIVGGLLIWLRPAKASTEQSIIKTEIQLANCPATGTSTNLLLTCQGSASTYSSQMKAGRYGMVNWQPGLYGGDVKVYLEVVGDSSSGAVTSTFGLYDVTANSGSAIGGSEVTTTSTTPVRLRSSNIAGVLKQFGGHNFAVVQKNSGGASNLFSAKLIVIQAFPSGQLTSTAHYIELGSNKLKSSGSTSYADVEDGEYFTYDASKYDGSLRFYLDVTTVETSGVTENFILLDATTGLAVPMTSASTNSCTPDPDALCFTGTPDARLQGQITGGLVSGHSYKLQYKVTANSQRISMAHLIIVQTPVIDQEQTDNSAVISLDGTSNTLAARAVGQQFQVSNSNYYSGVSIQANKVASPADNLKITLRTDFDGTLVADPVYLSVSSLSTTLSSYNLFFSRPVWLTGHTTYILEIERTGSADTTNYFQIGESGSDGSYSGGSLYFYGLSNWLSGPFFGANEMAFQIFTYQYPSRFETYQQLANSGQTTISNSYVLQNQPGVYKDTESGAITEFARTVNTVYFEATLKAGGTAYAQLSDGTGTVSTTSGTYTNVRSAAFNPATDTDLDVQIKSGAAFNSTTIAKGALVIDVSIAPAITTIAPSHGPTGGGGMLTIYGSGFHSDATVSIGGQAATEVFVVNSNTITAKAPTASVAGAADVVVTNAGDSQFGTYAKGYTYDDGIVASLSKTTNSGFTAGGSSLTNLSSGVVTNMSRFVWQNYTPSSAGGYMATGNYSYVVTALDDAGNESTASPETPAVAVSSGGSTGSVALQWRVIANAFGYKLYRTTNPGTYSSALVTTLPAASSSSGSGYITYTDTLLTTSAGAPPGSDSTTRGLRLQQGTVPADNAGLSGGSSVAATVGAGAHAFRRPDGKYVVVLGGGSAATRLYDPATNTFAAGPTLPAAAGTGALTIERPDGHFWVASGGGTNTTCLYDPGVFGSNCTSDSTITTGAGAHAFKRPDGKYVVVAGGTSTATYIYDPIGDTVATGPVLSANATSGALSIRRPDGNFITALGGTAALNLYDPTANSYSTSGMPSVTTGSGAHAIQRPDGQYLIVAGGGTTNSSLYDPVANTITAGPALSAVAGAGAHALQRPDGKYLVILGNNSNATSIYDPVANTFTAGPTTILVNATTGAFSLQRPDGKYLVMMGGGSSTNIYAAGWNTGSASDGGTVGTYVSEALHAGDLSSWQKIAWQTAFSADGGQDTALAPNIGSPNPILPTSDLANWQSIGQQQAVDGDVKVEVKTAVNQTGLNSLSSATYRTVGNGDSISAAASEQWLQVRITFTRRVPGWTAADHGGTDVWTGESSTFANRYFAQPTIKSLNLTYSQLSITSIAPNVGPSAGGTPFTIIGAGFEPGAKVTIGGQPAANVFVVSSTTITGLTPGGHTASAQDVVVTNPAANISQTKAAAFTFSDSYNQQNLTTIANFTAAGSTLKNVSSDATYHIKMNEGAFQWISYDSNSGGLNTCGGSKLVVCQYSGNTSINSGGLATGNYFYKVTALDKDGHESLPGPESGGVSVTGNNGSVKLHWRPIQGAYGYKVYRTTSSGSYGATSLSGYVSINSAAPSTASSYISFLDVATTLSSGTPPTSTDATTDALFMDRYISIPGNATAATCPSTTCDGPAVQGGTIGAGAHALKLPSGKFLVILGDGSTTTNIYDPASDTFTTSGAPTLSAVASTGSHSIERSDGKFLIVHGTTSDIYDPVTGTLSAGPSLTGSVSAGALSLPISTDKFIIFLGGSTTTTNIYDTATNRIRLGPSSPAAIGSGAAAIYRPSTGTYLVLSTSGTSIPVFDPATISFSTSTVPATSLAQTQAGSHVAQSPDGRYAILGSGGSSTQVTILEPNSAGGETSSGGLSSIAGLIKANALPTGVGAGAHAIQRPDGNIVDLRGGGSTGSTVIDSIYDAYSTGPTMRAAISTGAFSIHRPDGKYLVFHGGSLSSTTILDVGWQTNNNLILNNSFETDANDWTADGAATPSQTTGQSRYGSAGLQVATTAAAGDGVKYGLKLLASTQYDISFYGKLSSGTFSTLEAGYAADGSTETACSSMSSQTLVTSGWTRITCTITPGTISGSPYFYIKQTDGTARTFYIDNASVVRDSTVASYTSPDIQPTDIATSGTTWGQVSWVKSLDEGITTSNGVTAHIEVKTATDTTGLAAASWVDVASGDTIGSAGQKAMKFRVTFTREIAGWAAIDHGGTDVWTSEGTSFNNRNFAMPTLQSLTVGYVTDSGTYGALPSAPTTASLIQYRADGSTPLATGEATSEDKIVFVGTMKNATNASDILTLEVEAEPIGTAFTGTPNIIGSGVTCSGGTCSSGVTGTATALGLPGNSYHWQARVRGIAGASSWSSYDTNSDTLTADTDFTVVSTAALMRHGATFINNTLQPLCATHFCKP